MTTSYASAFVAAVLLNVALTVRSSEMIKPLWKWLYQQQQPPPSPKLLGGAVHDEGEEQEQDHPTTSKATNHNNQKQQAQWQSLIYRYLVVYLLATAADWLQGAYIFILYHAFGYTQYDIGVLFIAGFGSSAVFGSFMGGLADAYGRRLFVLVYGASYALSCVTKHFNNFFILVVGRILGGIATSLLFSIFETWLIRAHTDANLKPWISKSFTWAAYANSLVAIASGLIANQATESNTLHAVGGSTVLHMGGYLNPFDLALLASVACAVVAAYCWEENYGTIDALPESNDDDDPTRHGRRNAHWCGGLSTACTVTWRSREILLCGLVSSLYEASMYIFIFMWTPAMMQFADEASLPFGLIFSTFMVYSMAGSSLFSIGNDYYSLESQALFVLVVAAVSMGILLWTNDSTSQYAAMNLFEFTIGMYFPVIGCLKSAIVPESQRAAIYNLYRIPLNLIVLFGLLTDISPGDAFALNLGMLLTACVLQMALIKCREKNGRIKVLRPAETDSLTDESDFDMEAAPV